MTAFSLVMLGKLFFVAAVSVSCFCFVLFLAKPSRL